MALRLVEAVVPGDRGERLTAALPSDLLQDAWREVLADGRCAVRLLVDAAQAEQVLDDLEKALLGCEYRAVILPVEGVLPAQPEAAKEATDGDEGTARNANAAQPPARISRTELLEDLADGIRLDRTFVATVLLSAIIAAVGLLQDDVAILIAAMVIAPLLTPNMALSLATTLGDLDMLRRALRALLWGGILSLAFAAALGALMSVDVGIASIASRTEVEIGHLVLALTAGTAGALAFTSGVSASLVGVMVAVALLPPLVVTGLLLGSGHLTLGGRALLLFLANVICVNLSGVVTFICKGVRPRTWWEADRARRATRRAVLIWSLLLLALLAVVLYL